jgi:hypothetical protein
MMDAAKISKLVNKQELVEVGLIDELNAIIQEYPYFSTAYALKIKALALKDEGWKDYLPTAAIHVPQRDRLFNFINNISFDSIDIEEVNLAEEINEPQQIKKKVQLTEIEEVTSIPEETLPEEVVTETLPSPKTEVVETVADKEIKASDNKNVSASTTEKPQSATDEDLLILDEDSNAPDSQAEAIQSNDIEKVTKKSELPKKERKPQRRVVAVSAIDILSDEYDPDANSNDPIDQFLIKQPGAIRADDEAKPTKSFENEEDANEDEIPASEPLAKIYAQQGHYQKAIGIYEKLRLKIPEKSSYFALQIEEIRKKIQ